MTGNYGKLRQVFDAAVALPPGARTEWVRIACGGDQALYAEVMELLASHRDAEGFIPSEPPYPQPFPAANGGHAGKSVGPYRLLREIGRGGMGTVYQAVRADDAFRKTVAVKIMRPEICREDFLGRFRQERQILAGLDHPNIARILDGGTTDDRLPYFVMDFVDGQPIDRHCDNLRLNLAARLRLMRQVCGAVEYLHANHVIHRDLKPGNILVTAVGVPKLLDFGIAKVERLGEPPTVAVAGEERPLTPKYASPEQLAGDAVGKSSDIYALGVILYELVTGRNPRKSMDEAACRNTVPPKPSLNLREDLERMPETTAQLRRRVAGDLDNIVLKALHPQPARRYASAAELSEDLQRYLDGRPVLARPAGIPQRVFKFVRRNRAAAAIAAMIVLLAGVGLWQTLEARVQRERVNAQGDERRRLAEMLVRRLDAWAALTPAQQAEDVRSFCGLLHDGSRQGVAAGARTATGSGLVRDALAYLDRAAGLAATAEVAREVASAYAGVAGLQRAAGPLPDREGAASSLHKSAAILRRYSRDEAARQQLAAVLIALAALGPDPAAARVSAAVVRDPLAKRRPRPDEPPAPPPPAKDDPPPPPQADPELRNRYIHADSQFRATQQVVESIGRSLGPDMPLDAALSASVSSAQAYLEEAFRALNAGDDALARRNLDRAEYETGKVRRRIGR